MINGKIAQNVQIIIVIIIIKITAKTKATRFIRKLGWFLSSYIFFFSFYLIGFLPSHSPAIQAHRYYIGIVFCHLFFVLLAFLAFGLQHFIPFCYWEFGDKSVIYKSDTHTQTSILAKGELGPIPMESNIYCRNESKAR